MLPEHASSGETATGLGSTRPPPFTSISAAPSKAPVAAKSDPALTAARVTASKPVLRLAAEELPAVSIGIRVKLVGLMVATSFLIVMTITSYFASRQISELRVGLRERATTYGRLAGLQLRSAVAFNDQQTAREALEAIAKDPLVNGVALFTEKGSRLALEGYPSELAQSCSHGFGVQRTFYLPSRVLVTTPVRSLEGPRGTLVLELSTSSVVAARERLVRAAVYTGMGALLFGIALAWWIASSLARRVAGIARAAAAVAKGDLEQHLTLDGPRDEIGVLAFGFDAMVRRLRELIAHVHETAREENARLELLVQDRTVELDRKNSDLRLVLDNVEQGFVTIDRDAAVVGERSAVVDDWIRGLRPGASLWDCVDEVHPGCGMRYEMAWSQVVDDFMPLEVTLAQMPRELTIQNRHLRFDYKPLGGDDFEKVLVVISDSTAIVERAKSERQAEDVLALSTRLFQDRAGALEFMTETHALLNRIKHHHHDLTALKRDLHTLKGNSALFGLSQLSRLCHCAEAELETAPHAALNTAPMADEWEHMQSKIEHLLGERPRNVLEVPEGEHRAFLDAVQSGADTAELLRLARAWQLEALRLRLERAAEQLTRTVARLGKGPIEVQVEARGIYLAREELSEFWAVFAHVVRNAAVHGLTAEAERVQAGKPRVARFALRANVDADRLSVAITDPGPGVNWDALRTRAIERGLNWSTHEDLIDALFTDGVSTANSVDEMAGRGVGLSAVRAACLRKNGQIDVDSSDGCGSTFRFSWPRTALPSLACLDTREVT